MSQEDEIPGPVILSGDKVHVVFYTGVPHSSHFKAFVHVLKKQCDADNFKFESVDLRGCGDSSVKYDAESVDWELAREQVIQRLERWKVKYNHCNGVLVLLSDFRLSAAPAEFLDIASVLFIVYDSVDNAIMKMVTAKEEYVMAYRIILPSTIQNFKTLIQFLRSGDETSNRVFEKLIFVDDQKFKEKLMSISHSVTLKEALGNAKAPNDFQSGYFNNKLGGFELLERGSVEHFEKIVQGAQEYRPQEWAGTYAKFRKEAKRQYKLIYNAQVRGLKTKEECIKFVLLRILPNSILGLLTTEERKSMCMALNDNVPEVIKDGRTTLTATNIITEESLKRWKEFEASHPEFCNILETGSILDLISFLDESENQFITTSKIQGAQEVNELFYASSVLLTMLYPVHNKMCRDNESVFELSVRLLKTKNPLYIMKGALLLKSILAHNSTVIFSRIFSDMDAQGKLTSSVAVAAMEGLSNLFSPVMLVISQLEAHAQAEVHARAQAQVRARAQAETEAYEQAHAHSQPETEVNGQTQVHGQAELDGQAEVQRQAELDGEAKVDGQAEVRARADTEAKQSAPADSGHILASMDLLGTYLEKLASFTFIMYEDRTYSLIETIWRPIFDVFAGLKQALISLLSYGETIKATSYIIWVLSCEE